MATIESRKNADGTTSYRVKVRIGAVRDSATFSRKTDAKLWGQQREADIRQRGVHVESHRTLAEAIEQYRRCELPKVAASDRRNREAQLDWWTQRRGKERLSALTRGMLRGDLEALRACGPSGRPVSFATANRYQAALSAVLTAALEDWEWIPANPLHRSGRRRRPKSEREIERDRELSQEEWGHLVPRLKASGDPRLYPLVLCAFASGARQGELLGMQWSKLELHPREYDPTTGATRPGMPRYLLDDSKTGDSRMLYFPGEAGEVLCEMARCRSMSSYVWGLPTRPRDEVPAFPRDAFRYALRMAKIKDFHFHDLRHQWACSLLDHGAELAQLMVLGGWRSVAMVRRYTSRAQRRGSAAVAALHRQRLS